MLCSILEILRTLRIPRPPKGVLCLFYSHDADVQRRIPAMGLINRQTQI